MKTTEIGTVTTRYPGNDPENGPAYKQRWTGSNWECANHVWNYGACIHCGERDPGLNWRKDKRYHNKHGDSPVYYAYLEGQCGMVRHYPPPGRRRAEYERGRAH